MMMMVNYEYTNWKVTKGNEFRWVGRVNVPYLVYYKHIAI